MMLFLPALTGILLIAAFPRFNQEYAAWIAFVPLIASVFRSNSIAHAFFGGFIAGAVELFVLLIWIPSVLRQYGGLPVVLAWIAHGLMVCMLACYPGVACAATKWLMKGGGNSFLLSLPAIWVLLEYAQTHSPFGGFPWLLAGYSQSDQSRLVQIADITGAYGISFLILWFGVALFWAVRNRGRNVSALWPLMMSIALIAVCLIYGEISLRYWRGIAPEYRVAILQGNLTVDDGADVVVEKLRHGYSRLKHAVKSPNLDLLILPESPSPVTFQSDGSYRESLESLARSCRLGLVFNNIRSCQTEGGQQYFNSAYFLDAEGSLVGVYDKVHLVPFGEYIPAKRLLFFVRTVSRDVGEFSPGNEPRVIRIGDRQMNAAICFEAVFPGLMRQFVRNGSQLIINLTNDGWYGESAAPYQHFAIARWRAIENRRYLLRAANTGISAIIEPTGEMQTATRIMREAVCEGRFGYLARQTFYTRNGDVFVLACAIICTGSLIYSLRRKV